MKNTRVPAVRLFSTVILLASLCSLSTFPAPAQASNSPVNINDEAASYYDSGVDLYEAGYYSEALRAFMRAVELEPNFALAYNGIGVVNKRLGLYSEALKALQRAVRLDPGLAVAYYNLGQVYAQTGLPQQAVIQYLQAMRLKPDYAEAHNNLGNVLQEQGQPEAALASERALTRPGLAAAEVTPGRDVPPDG